MYFIYVLRCVDSSLYCGWTNDVEHRIKAHTGKIPGGAKYTRAHAPVRVECVWGTETKEAAMKLEYAVKKLPKAKKEALILDEGSFTDALSGKLDASLYARCDEYTKDLILSNEDLQV